ncbi:hypothetical protein BC834DRAFT_843769 [Gloeopeniophorella convolvens]|nr:hypothetical protein BC834DRAFT_843769 [Gloeopeniophorella convolvens]
MHLYGLTLGFLLPSLALYVADSAIATPSALVPAGDLAARDPSSSELLRRRAGIDPLSPLILARDDDEHEHGHGHGNMPPIVELNETEILLSHAPTPPSYWSIDIDDRTPEQTRYPGLMGFHALMMSLAFFGALPAGIALRSVNHAWHGFSVILFWTFVVLGCAASGLYRKLTPNMYEGQKHSAYSYLALAVALVLSAIDAFAGARRLLSYVRVLKTDDKFTIRSFWNSVILGREERHTLGINDAEYTNLVVEEPEEMEDLKVHIHSDGRVVFAAAEGLNDQDETAQWANHVRHSSDEFPETPASERTLFGPRSPRGSQHSDDTLHDHNRFSKDVSLLRRAGQLAFATLERSLVFAGFAQLMHGVVIYTGGCRESYVNGCLAHVISKRALISGLQALMTHALLSVLAEGGIFWCYGLVTFARFLGSFSERGWAWNRAPTGEHVSAEFTESFVIFFYGITNTWMERFGAHPGDPYTTKQVQHISIAVMFWFAGLVGMGLESRILRRWLAAVSTASLKIANRNSEAVAEPASYGGSFNPFPALVIGVTGAAMSAHYQEYLFQVQIHALWGYCLSAFAVLRCLTYLFVWLAPPRSILPSRPPSEALASFFLACGGLVFVMSNEEITFAAIRRGHDGGHTSSTRPF